jgi:flagellar biosynthesis/type III secretory pathway protein FliH
LDEEAREEYRYEEGLQESRETGLRETARKMKELGEPEDKIAAVTGLPAEELKKLWG